MEMEMNEDDGFLEEFLALRRETWDPTTDQLTAFFSPTTTTTTTTTTTWSGGTVFDSTPPPPPPPLSVTSSSSYLDLADLYAAAAAHHQQQQQQLFSDEIPCKAEPPSSCLNSHDIIPTTFNVGGGGGDNAAANNSNTKNSKVKKVEGQPSKNLMAERRRRKRLNDRLSMLRSVVPKISKMDRTSILGDTIDYMKELLERINNLQEEAHDLPDVDADAGSGTGSGANQINLLSIFRETKPNELLVRNSPKFDVERRSLDTRVEICCPGKPGLLLSTVTTLEALGLEIQQCVISCFNDFSLQASCSEEMEQRSVVGSEDIKQALFRNAGYGGRCL